ncbi:HAD family hydrolase [Rhodococcus globerulus]|uniref:HAD family phosphatase n=1 Tax=Rhodococcus globerulus TaxID=33008 RepID=A0ABU4C3L2_RHOGO|nr:HAD family phosphatase [Rhodococcus globerulus]MDV6270879.1 HAD family phosphatase [Rhodococcus globerulus]
MNSRWHGRAVIFDCDGTIADSETLSLETWDVELSRFGYRLTDEDRQFCVGSSYEKCYGHFASLIADLPPADVFDVAYREHLDARYRSDLTAFEDALDVLEFLRENDIPVVVASNSDRRRLALTMSLIGIEHLPSVAGDEVPSPKPAPDIFVRAAAVLGVEPNQCLVIEDSQPGVDGALAAGIPVWALQRATHAPVGASHLTRTLDRNTLVSLLDAQIPA